jgi:hypothetical protein
MGEFLQHSSVAYIITVACEPIYSEQTVTIDASELWFACKQTLSWAQAPGGPTGLQPQFTVSLDNDGNGTAVLWGGPSCAAGTFHLFASLNAPPFTTVRFTLTVIPPGNTPVGIKAAPPREVEDSITSSVATVIQVEFPSVQAEKWVHIKSQELFTRCQTRLAWWGPDETPLSLNTPDVTVQLDNNGNAFVVVIAGPSCASGTSTISASLTTVPYTTLTNTFTILSPRVINP